MRLLDLFCGAGGCSVGYARAGFDVVGVDIEPHPDYPFEFVLADATDVLQDCAFLEMFDAVHASPPCQAFTRMGSFGTMGEHPDLLTGTLVALRAWGGTWVVENVPGAPLVGLTLCGSMFPELRVRRHRIFASDLLLYAPGPCRHDRPAIPVVGHGVPSSFRKRHGYSPTVDDRRRAMGIDWMRNREDLAEAIPPAYTEHIGHQLMAHLRERAA